MKKNNNYTENSVVNSISKKHSIYVNTINKIIRVVKDSVDIGIHTWGKIDYLCSHHGYILHKCSSISKSSTTTITPEDSEVVDYKVDKYKKINMAAMSKNAMKKVKASSYI